MGSAITSYTQMKCFFILYGNKGNNGKSTLMEIMENIFNDLFKNSIILNSYLIIFIN